jgi:hypothetical protein
MNWLNTIDWASHQLLLKLVVVVLRGAVAGSLDERAAFRSFLPSLFPESCQYCAFVCFSRFTNRSVLWIRLEASERNKGELIVSQTRPDGRRPGWTGDGAWRVQWNSPSDQPPLPYHSYPTITVPSLTNAGTVPKREVHVGACYDNFPWN